MAARRYILLLSVALYLVSMPMDAFCEQSSCSDWPGFGILLFGVFDFLVDQRNLTWFANPLLFAAWLLIWREWRRVRWRALGGILGVLAAVLAIAFLFRKEIVTNEAGIPFPITGLRIGYWLWLASIGTAVAAAFMPGKPRASVVEPTH
ncbi:MAG TPA: hypothetical protein VL574_04840 [Stellaceae bacterium]|nr:hypothetical protein [Stellaceae bacterium]